MNAIFEKSIMDFLYFGYLPQRNAAAYIASEYKNILYDNSIDYFSEGDFEKMQYLIEKILSEFLPRSSSWRVGVSSGYDSRLILAALNKLVPEENIYPFTTGTKGNKDVTLAPLFLADQFSNYTQKIFDVRTKPEVINSEQEAIGLAGLTVSAKISNRRNQFSSNILYRYFTSFRKNRSAPEGSPIFNGFMGDPLAGSHLMDTPSKDIHVARSRHVRRYSQYVKGAFFDLKILRESGIFSEYYEPDDSLEIDFFLSDSEIDIGEQFDLFYRQFQFIRLLAPQQYLDIELQRLSVAQKTRLLHAREAVLTPFNDFRWKKSWMKSSRQARLHQKSYKSFLKSAYPEMFPDLVDPDDKKYHIQNKKTNPDWRLLWENSKTFRKSVRCIIESLADRDILWFDPRIIFEFAESEIKGFDRLMQGFCALEMNFRLSRFPLPRNKEWQHVFWG